ncbi:hypothetical protein ACIQMJ_22020 [Actinosynnema sp. NPDC091369]
MDEATIPPGPLGLLVLVTAAVTWWAVNYSLVVLVLRVSNPDAPIRAPFRELTDQLVVAAALCLGIGMAALLIYTPWLVLVPMATVVVLHQQFILSQLRRQVRADPRTGLLDPVFFAPARVRAPAPHPGAASARGPDHDRPRPVQADQRRVGPPGR